MDLCTTENLDVSVRDIDDHRLPYVDTTCMTDSRLINIFIEIE
jgi:hypothetical protein